MQKLYGDTERQLMEVSYTIPLDNNPDVYSPRLYNILQFSCAQIHSLFKTISTNLKLQIKSDMFPEYYKILNEKGMLQSQEVLQLQNRESMKPFNETEQHDWWAGYNDTKHQLPEGIRQGTLGNVLNALAAAFILNNIANISGWKHEPHEILDGKNWYNIIAGYGRENLKIIQELRTQNPINSTFFYLITQYWSQGAGL